jgi:hypothetical protein
MPLMPSFGEACLEAGAGAEFCCPKADEVRSEIASAAKSAWLRSIEILRDALKAQD